MRIDLCSFWCRKRMRALSHVGGLVRVSLPKRILTSPLYVLYGNSLPPLLSKKAYVASYNQEIARVRSQFSASTVRLGQDRLRGVLESRTVRVSGRHRIP